MALPEFSEIENVNLEQLVYGKLTWINIQPPTERSREYLRENYPFHPLDLDDILSRIQRPKLDQYPEYLFFVFNFPRYHKKEQVLSQSQVSVFIGQEYLITIHKGELKPVRRLFEDCREDEAVAADFMGSGTGYLLYRILDRLVDYCIPILNKTGDGIEDVEDRIFSPHPRGSVREISRLRRDVIAFRRTIWPMRTLLAGLETRLNRFSARDLTVYFGDMVDHLEKIWDGLNEYKEIIEGLNDTYDSLASNRINEVLRVLTILTTIGTVLTVVVGFYGMNVPLPGGSNPGGLWDSWIVILAALVLIIAWMLYYFYRKGWL